MTIHPVLSNPPQSGTQPLCPVFGHCGGCQYQDLPYSQELELKEQRLKNLFLKAFNCSEDIFDPIVPSPRDYYYRNHLDLSLLRLKTKDLCLGFYSANRRRLIPVEACPIALSAISDFLPRLKQQALLKLPEQYRNANLVIKTGDDGKVFWGGIGRHSLRMKEQDYLWTQVHGKKIFYSLNSFFQANLSILPLLITKIKQLNILSKQTIFFDLYGGVGFMGVCLYELVKNVILIEENIHSIKLARFNVHYHQMPNFEIIHGKVEEKFPVYFDLANNGSQVAMIDPPRCGLSAETLRILSSSDKFLNSLLYLSCNPDSLLKDLFVLRQSGWKISKICPFDFFPKTKHIETLVILGLENKSY